MARKKDKIRVELDLPKDDSTLTKLYVILGISMFLGVASFGFWVTNSGFLPTTNDAPMFINLACGPEYANIPQHTIYDNDTLCQPAGIALLADRPATSVYESSAEWTDFHDQAQEFTIPGSADAHQIAGHQTQVMVQMNEVSAAAAVAYEVYMVDLEDDSDIGNRATCQSSDPASECVYGPWEVEPGDGYSLVISSLGTPDISRADFTITVDYYDGVPDNMNNASLWIGPELELGSLSLRPAMFLNFFGLGFFFLFFPASFYWDRVQKRINDMEEKFPDFLRDLAEYWKGGLSMTIAVQTLASSEYGTMNDEVKKMSDQLSWGISFGNVIGLFADRVNTPLVKRAISLIQEANRAGGKISDILVTAANDSREIKFLEGERVRAISSYIAVIWVSYGVFLGVIVVLTKVFIPAIASSNSGDSGDGGGSSLGNMTIRNIDPLFFLTIFYYGVTMQAMGNGAMAGLMSTGRFSSGMRHAGMMILLALLAFNVIAYTPDLIGVEELGEVLPRGTPYRVGG